LKTVKQKIIETKMYNPHLSMKEIARLMRCSYGYARKVWSKYQQKILTKRGEPYSPYEVHGEFLYGEVPVRWLDKCPLKASDNRNGQRLWRGRWVHVLFHKGGQVYVYPMDFRFETWRDELQGFLNGFWESGQTDLFLKSLEKRRIRSLAFHTPGVPKNFRVRIKGVGSLLTDTTPYRDGTTEFEYDPQMVKDLDDIKKSLKTFAVAMNQHMGLISEIQKLVYSLQDVVNELRKMR